MKTELEKITGKKLLTAFLAAALTLSLAACDKADNNSGSNAESSGESNFSSTVNGSSAEQSAPAGGDNSIAPDTPALPNSPKPEMLPGATSYKYEPCHSDNGMYYFNHNYFSTNQVYYNLMYIDIATKQDVYVCSDSSCMHNNILCSSVFEQSEFGSDGNMVLFTYGESLYILTESSGGSGGIGNGGPDPYYTPHASCLYRMGLDGSNREKIFTFDKELRVMRNVIGDGDNLWFCVYEETLEKNEELGTYYTGEKNKCMVKLSLSDRMLVEQIPIADRDKVSLEYAGCIENKMLFTGHRYPNGMSKREYMEFTWGMSNAFSPPSQEENELYAQIRLEYFTLDLETKVVKKVYLTENTNDDRYFFYDGALFVYDETKTVKINVDTGETEEFAAAEGYAAYDMTYDGKFMCHETTADRDWTIYNIDPDTGDILKEKEWQGAPGDYVLVTAVFGDKVLINIGYYRTWVVSPSGDMRGREHYEMYALMSLEDYNNRIYNIEPIKMIHEGEGDFYAY